MNRLNDEKGQAVFLAAGLLLLFLVIAAVVMDLGWWLHDKRDAQNDVDSSVLAGAQDLPGDEPGQDPPCDTAELWASWNGASGQLSSCTTCRMDPITGVCGEDPPHNLIRATVERPAGRLEKGLLDIAPFNITASAAAAKMRAVAACVTPWGVLGNPAQGPLQGGHWGLVPRRFYGFHADNFITPGNFGALALYGNGAIDYKEAITTPCGTGTVGACDQTDPQVPVGETLQCDVKTGNMGQNTRDALTQRDHDFGAGAFCNVTTYDEAVQMVETSAACAGARAVLIPIIVQWPPQGHSGPVQILGIATFYITGWADKPNQAPDMDGDTEGDMVWGYFLENVPVIPAWNVTWGYSDDPFAPINILLVE